MGGSKSLAWYWYCNGGLGAVVQDFALFANGDNAMIMPALLFFTLLLCNILKYMHRLDIGSSRKYVVHAAW